MEIILKIAEIRVSLCSDYPITVDPPCADFVTDSPEYDVRFRFTGWTGVPCPASRPIGQDLILRYYQEGNIRCCERMNGPDTPSSRTWYPENFTDNTCYMRYPVAEGAGKASVLLHQLPIYDLLRHFNASLLHAAEVGFHGKGLLFSAPSGTGKTTQAKLWKQWENARMISGDRTVLRRFSGGWSAYGLPFDGSSRIWSAAGLPLGAVIVLRQAEENQVSRLTEKEAFRPLLEQTIFLRQSREKLEESVDSVLQLIKEVPVYLLKCRPDRGAVLCLKDQLLKDGVFV